MNEVELTKKMQDYRKREEEKRKSIKHGDNVIHLDYFSGLINQEDIEYMQSLYEKTSLEFSSYDKSGTLYNSIKDYSLPIFLFISQPIVLDLLKSTTINLISDAIKKSILFIASKAKNKKYYETDGKKIESKTVKFGIKIKSPTGGKFDFNFDGAMSEEKVNEMYDKALEVIRTTRYSKDFYCEYEEHKQDWNKIDIMKEIRKKHK